MKKLLLLLVLVGVVLGLVVWYKQRQIAETPVETT